MDSEACHRFLPASTAPVPARGEELRIPARHDHLKGACEGTLVIDETGVRYQSPKHRFSTPYPEIQQLEIATGWLRVTTYQDNRWRLGADREWRVQALPKQEFSSAAAFLRVRMDQRLVVRLAEESTAPLWQAPAKLLSRLGGAHGVLAFGAEAVSFTAPGAKARTWRYTDVQTIYSTGPFELILTTWEDGGRPFRFQLKQRLTESAYDALWQRVERARAASQAVLNQETP